MLISGHRTWLCPPCAILQRHVPKGAWPVLKSPFSREKLRARYGSRDTYLQRLNEQIDKMRNAGWLFPDDAGNLKQREAERQLF